MRIRTSRRDFLFSVFLNVLELVLPIFLLYLLDREHNTERS
jgi:hypothetical protein